MVHAGLHGDYVHLQRPFRHPRPATLRAREHGGCCCGGVEVGGDGGGSTRIHRPSRQPGHF